MRTRERPEGPTFFAQSHFYTSFVKFRTGEGYMRKLFVGNIPHSSSEVELQQWVEHQGFNVESAQIIRDRSTGQSRGFGFVVLNEEWRVKEAISALNGK